MIQLFDQLECTRIKDAFSKYFIMTDDGHGWFTQGKRSFTEPPFLENEFNSVTESKLLLLLDFCGVHHEQLSPGWIDTELNHRDRVEHEIVLNAREQNLTPLGVSIHCDAWEDPVRPGRQNDANGFCVYYWKKGRKFSTKGKQLARCVADSIIEYDRRNGYYINPRHQNGISGANFFVLQETEAVWVLVENAFMTSNKDLIYLRRDDFRNDRAVAILEGFYNYIKL